MSKRKRIVSVRLRFNTLSIKAIYFKQTDKQLYV